MVALLSQRASCETRDFLEAQVQFSLPAPLGTHTFKTQPDGTIYDGPTKRYTQFLNARFSQKSQTENFFPPFSVQTDLTVYPLTVSLAGPITGQAQCVRTIPDYYDPQYNGNLNQIVSIRLFHGLAAISRDLRSKVYPH